MDSVDARLDLQRRGRTPLTLSAAQLAEIAAEIAPLIEGAELSAVHALPPRDLLLVFTARNGSFARRIRVSGHPDAGRVHLQHERVAPHDGPIGPFFRRAIDELVGSRAKRVATVRGDRVLRFDFDETPSGRARALIVELFGRRTNLLLVDGDDRILEVLVPPPDDKPDARSKIGSVWQAPSGRTRDEVAVKIVDAFPEAPPAPRDAHEAPLSWRVEFALERAAREFDRERASKELLDRLERKLERARGLEHGLRARLEASENAERVREDGELLKANLSSIARGAKAVEVVDFFGAEGATRTIEIDPRKKPMENAEHCFDRYHKLLRARANVVEELERAAAKIRAIDETIAAARDAAQDIEAVAARAIERGVLDPPQESDPRRRKAPEPRKPYRTYVALRGSEVRVGKSAADNDDLTLHHARGNDLWLHTADTPGSHVVLVLAGRPEPDPEELLDAAHLAAHFSPLRGALRCRVHVARKKEVHKPKGAKPGLVHLSGGKIVDLRVQPERIRRLLETARTADNAASDT